MRRNTIIACLLTAGLVGLGSPALAGEAQSFTLGAMGGVGGFFDADPDGGLGNQAVQMSFSLVTEEATLLGLRLGRLDQDPEGAFAPLGGGELTWLDMVGEYRFSRPLYDSGMYLGLGAYRFAGDAVGSSDQTTIGAVFGLTGQFDLTERWAILIDLSAHYADLDVAQTFGVATAGAALSF